MKTDLHCICSALRSAARPFSRSELLQKANALSAKAFGLHLEAEQNIQISIYRRLSSGFLSVLVSW
jgi:hypothetical protein